MDAEPAAGADHGDGLAGLDVGAAQHLQRRRQRVGDDADLGRMFLVIEAGRQLDEVRRRQLDVFGIGAVAFEADLAAGVLAERLQVPQAPAAMAAVQVEISGDGIADLEAANARAHLDDLAGDLMADDARERDLPPPGLGVLDGEAGAAGDDAGHGLARTGDRIGPLHEFERQVRAVQHHRLHVKPSKLGPANFRGLACGPNRL